MILFALSVSPTTHSMLKFNHMDITVVADFDCVDTFVHGELQLLCLPRSSHYSTQFSVIQGRYQGESVNILLNFTQFFETRIEYRFQIFTAHSCDFLLPSYARLA